MYRLLKLNKNGNIEQRLFNTKKLALRYAYFLLSLRHVAKIKLYNDNKLLLSMAVNERLKFDSCYFLELFNNQE